MGIELMTLNQPCHFNLVPQPHCHSVMQTKEKIPHSCIKFDKNSRKAENPQVT